MFDFPALLSWVLLGLPRLPLQEQGGGLRRGGRWWRRVRARLEVWRPCSGMTLNSQ